MITETFSNATEAFHAGLVTFQTHRVNKDFSNAIKG